MKLIRSKVIHSVDAPNSDQLNGQWHSGYRLPESETVAFHHRGKWWASNPVAAQVTGPYESKTEALNEKGKE